MILDGKTLAKKHLQEIALTAKDFQQKWHRPAELALLFVGKDPASQIYVEHKRRSCAQVGIRSQILSLPEHSSQEELESCIFKLKEREETDAILVQLPLPNHLNLERIFRCLPLEKDVDGLSYIQRGLLTEGKALVQPCTPQGILRLLDHYSIPLKGRHALVIGRSAIVGRPMAELFLGEDASITICHSKTFNLRSHTLNADIVVVAAGKAHFLGKEDFHSKSIVIDVGIHRIKPKGGKEKEKLCGDVRFHEVKDFVKAITPVPGGVGPMTISCLLSNTLKLAQHRMHTINCKVKHKRLKDRE